MRRKAVAKPSAGLTKSPSLAKVHRELSQTWHLHVCTTSGCRLVYECSCVTAGRNGLCSLHRGTRRPLWELDREPAACCYGNTKQVTRSEALLLYRLAGPGPWFQCSTCARSFGWAVRKEGAAK